MSNCYLHSRNVPFPLIAAIFIAFLFSSIPSNLYAQACACSNCPQFMPDNFVGDFNISVQGATSNALGVGGQGVCGVNLSFDHEYLGDLSITLTSPGGQTVTLVGPIGFFGPTDGAQWNVSFLPCSDPSVSPDAGFPNVWDNNNNWLLNTSYTGSYYPASGCLEGFNSGPVNGTWSLTVTDGQAVDVGQFTNYEIIFCDPSGINCFSCVADAGTIPTPNVTACEGGANLSLNLPPSYSPPSTVEPPASDYTYTYVIGGSGGTIEGYEPGPDLSAYPSGTYTVCGLSYLTADAGNLPAPGSMTSSQLSTQLASNTPPFCGDMTSNCATVTISPAPDDLAETVIICAPDCYVFHSQSYCQSGNYTRTLTQNGCMYTATLDLTVIEVPPTYLTQTLCDGECSDIFGFASACTSGTYTQSFSNYLGCDSIVSLELTTIKVNVDIVPPGQIGCSQLSLDLEGIGPTSGNVTYTWSASNGGNITGPTNTLNTTVNTAGDYELTICSTAGGLTCCSTASVTVTERYDPPAAPDFISGSNVICPGETATFSITEVGTGGSYTWTVPPGVTINSGQGTLTLNVTWNSPSGGDVCVAYNNGCGTSDFTCLLIIMEQPAVPSTPTGPTDACAGVTATYQTTPDPNATSYTWTVTSGTIISGQGTSSINVNWGNSASGTVCVSASSACGISQPVCLPVQITVPPAAPTLAGSANGCAGAVASYSIGAINGATSYDWQVTGGTITSGDGTTSIQITWGASATSGSVCVAAVNSCANSASSCINVTLSALPAQPLISGNDATCEGTLGIYSIAPVSGATGYTWTLSAGGSITSGQNTTQINISWLSAPGGNVCVTANGLCGAGPQACFPVAVTTQPVSNAGAGGTVCGSTFNLQAIPSVAGSSGLWVVVPGAPGAVSFANPNTASTTVTATQTGTYVFVWQEQLNTCTSDDSITVSFRNNPVVGQVAHNCDGTNQNYTVTFPITNGTPPYTVAGGSVTNGVFTSNPILSGQPYSFQVTDANGCQSLVLTGDFNCACTTSAGTMSLTPLSACEGSSVTATHAGGQTLDANDVTAYVLHTSSGTALGTVLGQNATGTFSFQSGMAYETTYYVSFVVGNGLNGAPNPSDPCFSVAQGQPVVWHQTPTANAGANASTCGPTLPLTGNSGSGTGTWSVTSSPAGSTLSLDNAQSGTAVATAHGFGTYTLVWTIDNMGCTDTDEVQLTFNGSPVAGQIANACDGTNQNYIVSFPVTGGTVPYTVPGGTVANGTFTSNPIPSGQSYSFQVTDANGCQSSVLTGSFNCVCTTNAGTMSLAPLSACEGSSVTAIHAGGQTLDANDVTAYVLHTGSATTLGTTFGQNTTGTFPFQTGMAYETTYYVSFIAGNSLNGQPNPADPCFSVAQGQPVVWHQTPAANAGTDASTCGIISSLNGSPSAGTWSVTGNPTGGTLSLDNAQSGTAVATANGFGTYTLVWTVDNMGCTDTDEVQLTFNGSPTAGQIAHDCDGANQNYTVSFPVTGGTAPYTVTGGTVVNGTFTSSPIPSGQSYSFQVTDANGCQSAVLTGSFNCSCSTSAGTMSLAPLSACEGSSVTAIHTGDQVLDANDVTAYVLHTGSGTMLGTVLGQNATGTFPFQTGMAYETTYYVSFVAGNSLNGQPNPADPCFSVAQGQPVVWHQTPTANSGTDVSTCGLTSSLTGSPSAGTWSVTSSPTGGTLSLDNAQSGTAVATASGFGTYTLVWTVDNMSCTDTDEVQLTFNGSPTAGQIAHDCDGANQNYTVTFPVTGGTAPYTVPGGTVANGAFTSTAIPSTQSYSFQVTDANGCQSAMLTGSFNCSCSTSAGTMSLAPLSACEGSSVTATHTGDQTLDANDVTAYVLHAGSGTTLGTVLSQNATGVFSFQTGMAYETTYYVSFVAGNDLNGQPDPTDPCFSVAQGQPVVWHENPTANAGLDADTCGTALPLTGNTSTGAAGNWSVVSGPTGDTLSLGSVQSAVTTAMASGFGTYQLVWTIDNLGCTDTDTVQLTFNGTPVAGPAVASCAADNQDYTISLPLSGGTPPYLVSGTTTASNTFTSTPIANGDTYILTIIDANGCAAADVTGSFICNCTTQAGNMEVALLSACEGGSLTATHLGGEILDGDDVTAYILHTGNGTTLGTIFDQNATGTFDFQNGMTYDSAYYVSFVVGDDLNGEPDPADPCLAVAIGQPVVWHQNPVANAGMDADTCSLTLVLNGSGGAGQWTVSSAPNGATLLFANDQAAQSAVTASTTGTYSLTWTVSANGCVSTDQVDLQFNASPSLVDLVRSCNAANENFTVTLTLTGGTLPYTVNGTVVADSTFVSAAFSNGQTYTFNIGDANGCAAPAVNGAYSCNCATDAGTMSTIMLTACQYDSVTITANGDQSLDGNDVTAYALHDGAGPALGTVLSQNTTGTFFFQNGMIFGKTYHVSLLAGNPLSNQPNPLDPCFSVAIGQPVVWLQNPLPYAGPDTAVCGSTITLQAASGSFAGVWSQVAGPDTTLFAATVLSNSLATASASGSYVFRWTEANGTCTAFDEVTVNFNELPTVGALDETCDGTNTQFTVAFTVAGGTSPYTVNGLAGTFSGNIFTSAGLNNTSNYAFNVTDANGCMSTDMAGSKNCNCATDAGSVVATPATFCADQPAVATWNNDATLDANDLVQFILHSTSGTTVGTVYATAAQPSFPFTGNLQPGVVYYISAIAGDNLNGAVDLGDDCLSVTPGTPVQWKLLPTASLTGDATICIGGSTFLSFSGTGSFPLQLNYVAQNGDSSFLTLTGTQTVTLSVTPAVTTVYTLTNVVDGTLPACSTALNATATVMVNGSIEAGTAAAASVFCGGSNQTVQLAQQLVGADAGGVWTETSTVPSTAAFNATAATFNIAAQAPGTYTFLYRIDAAAPCVDDETTVTVVINPVPTADAGADKTLDCNTSAVTLGGVNTTAATGVTYEWTRDTTVVGTAKTLTTSTPSTYLLVVTNAAGCSATDMAIVVLDASLPSAKVSAIGVRCYGDKNGRIVVDSVVSSHPPVLFSLNDGPFSNSVNFFSLPPGEYTVSLQDASGCEWSSGPLTITEPPQLIASLGPDLSLSLGDTARVELQLTSSLATIDTIIWQPLLDSTAIGKPYQNWLPVASRPLGVRVVDTNGCVAEDHLIVVIDKVRHVYIPNIIAPGAAGNDIITVFGGRDVAEIELFQIYDRWGEQLFERLNFLPNSVVDGWSGNFRGKAVVPGVYVYYAVVRFKDGEQQIFTGDVTVMQ